MKNYNMLREKFVINTIEGFIKEYDGVKRGNIIGVRIVLSGPKDMLIEGILDRLAQFNPKFIKNQSMITFEGGSRISLFNQKNYEDYSKGLIADIVVLYNYDNEKNYISHSLKLMAQPDCLNKLIIV